MSVNGVQIHVLFHSNITRKQHTRATFHGFAGSAMGWDSLLNDLAGSDLQVIAIDMPGHGLSDAPMAPERYRIEQCQADILGVLREA